MTRLSVFIASSIDGYIATQDGNLDWLESAVLGRGRPLFHPVEHGSTWQLESVQTWPSGLVNRAYTRGSRSTVAAT